LLCWSLVGQVFLEGHCIWDEELLKEFLSVILCAVQRLGTMSLCSREE
jgi:hypothetical protein